MTVRAGVTVRVVNLGQGTTGTRSMQRALKGAGVPFIHYENSFPTKDKRMAAAARAHRDLFVRLFACASEPKDEKERQMTNEE